MRLFCMFATAAALFGLLVGCSKRLPDYPTLSAQQFTHKDTKNGLTVAIHPMTQESEVEQYFGTNLLEDDILPVLVVIENQNVDTSFILRKQEVQLLNAECQIHNDTKTLEAIGSLGPSTAVGVLISPWIGAAMATHAREVRRNFAMKELQQTTASPRDVKSGFVYFQLPNSVNSPKRWRLQIQVINLKNKMPLTFIYDLDWQRS